MNSNQLSRRSFLKHVGLAGVGAPFVTRGLMAASPNGVLHHASCGASGMAWADINQITSSPKARLVAVAEVDLARTAELKKKFPDARVYQDWREMLEQEGDKIDSVNVSTPDHMHAPIGLSAIRRGKHVYGQKPLAHEIREARRLTRAARRRGVTTQMGIQIHSAAAYRMAVELVQSGAIGKIKEVHSWSNKKWGDMAPRPDREDPVPEGLNWDFWLGVAEERPYIGEAYYHPGNWRKRLDFGTGTFGDMGCHIYDPVFNALALTAPISVRSEGPKPNAHNWAINALIHYVFPGTKFSEGDTVKVTWYDGDQRPEGIDQRLEGDEMPGQGSFFIGTEGSMLLPHVAPPQLYPIAKYERFRYPQVEDANHWLQWVDACLGEGKTTAGFDYAGPLTEAVLLGGAATHFPGKTLEWDAERVRFTNEPEANQHVGREYRDGWILGRA